MSNPVVARLNWTSNRPTRTFPADRTPAACAGVVAATNSAIRAETAPTRYAVYTANTFAALDVLHSRLLVGGAGASIASARRDSGILRMAASQIDGGTLGGVTCFNVYNASFAAATCN